MPILFVPVPEPPPPPVRVSATVPADCPCKTIEWHAPNGDVINFGEHPFHMLPGRKGFGRIEHEVISDRLLYGGHYVQNYRPSTRLINLPLAVNVADQPCETSTSTLTDAYERLEQAFRHQRAGVGSLRFEPGTLVVRRPDSTSRSIRAFYQGGLDGTEDVMDDFVYQYQEFPGLEFWCPDPLWEGDEVVLTYVATIDPEELGDYKPFYPIYPIGVIPSALSDTREFTNTSNEEIWPVWEFTGPGTPILENLETGEVLEFTSPIPLGTTIIVDTRPVSIAPETGGTIRDADTGESWWDRVQGEMFGLSPGEVRLNFTMSGADADSRLVLRFRERFMRAW